MDHDHAMKELKKLRNDFPAFVARFGIMQLSAIQIALLDQMRAHPEKIAWPQRSRLNDAYVGRVSTKTLYDDTQ